MKFKLLAVVAACAVSALSYGQSSNSNSGAVAGSSSTNSSTNNNTSNNNPVANANSGSSSGSISNATGGQGGQGGQAIGNSGNNQSNNRANSSSSSQTSSNSTANNAGNNQNNASTSRSSATGGQGGQGGLGGMGVGVGGQGGVGVGGSAGINANISPSTNITFTGPPVSTSNVNTRTTGETTQNLNQTYTGKTEQVLSGETYQYIDYGGTQTIKNVPNLNAPPLTSSNDTCMGSASGGIAIPGLGITGGSTYTDEHCKRIKMSRELWNKGMKAASLAMDCMDPAAKEALELTGFICPQTQRAQRAAAATAASRSALSSRSFSPVDPSREQPGFVPAAETPEQSVELQQPQRLASVASQGQRAENVAVRQPDPPLDGTRTLSPSEDARSQP